MQGKLRKGADIYTAETAWLSPSQAAQCFYTQNFLGNPENIGVCSTLKQSDPSDNISWRSGQRYRQLSDRGSTDTKLTPAVHPDFCNHTGCTALSSSFPSKLRFPLKIKDYSTSLCHVYITNGFSLSAGTMSLCDLGFRQTSKIYSSFLHEHTSLLSEESLAEANILSYAFLFQNYL